MIDMKRFRRQWRGGGRPLIRPMASAGDKGKCEKMKEHIALVLRFSHNGACAVVSSSGTGRACAM